MSVHMRHPPIRQHQDQTDAINESKKKTLFTTAAANSPELSEDSDGKLLVREEVQDGDWMTVGVRGAGPKAAEEVRLHRSNTGEKRLNGPTDARQVMMKTYSALLFGIFLLRCLFIPEGNIACMVHVIEPNECLISRLMPL